MEKILEFIKNHKKAVVITVTSVLVVALIILGLFLYLDHQNKQYKVEEVANFKYYVLYKDNKMGVIDTKGNIIVEPIYDDVKIPNPQRSVFICEKDESKIVQNANKETIFTEYEEVSAIDTKGTVSNIPYEKQVLRYKQNGKYGLINYEGKVITKPIYESIDGLENKESELLVKQNGKYGVINQKGAKIVKAEYDDIVADGYYDEEQKYALSGYVTTLKTQDGYRYGYINSKREKVLDVKYNSIYRVLELNNAEDVYLIATRNGQVGVVKNGKVIVNYAYQNIEYDDYNNLFILERSSKIGVADSEGNQIIPVDYEQINIKGIYIQAIGFDGNTTYFDINGNKIEGKYESVLKTNNENYLITIDKNGQYGIINAQEEVVLENNYRYLEYLYEDYFIASNEDGYLGIINNIGDIVVEFQYEVLQKVDNTNVIEAKKMTENITELYSAKLEKVYTQENASIYIYENYIEVYSTNEVVDFDLQGNKIENTLVHAGGLFAKKKDDKWGLIDSQNNVVVDFIYDKTTSLNEYGFAGIKKDGKWGVINSNGDIIQEPIYNMENVSKNPEFIGPYYKVYYGYGESYYTNEVKE